MDLVCGLSMALRWCCWAFGWLGGLAGWRAAALQVFSFMVVDRPLAVWNSALVVTWTDVVGAAAVS